MQTSVIKNICPNCGSQDEYDIINHLLIDIDLNIEYQCHHCGHRWSNTYGLFYLGYTDETGSYDRDGLKIRY